MRSIVFFTERNLGKKMLEVIQVRRRLKMAAQRVAIQGGPPVGRRARVVTLLNIIHSVRVAQDNRQDHSRWLFRDYYCVKCFLSMISFNPQSLLFSYYR